MKKTVSINRILLIRLSALGDCLCALPVFSALRKAYPKAHIAWAVQDNFAPLIRNLPGLDEVIIFPRQRWKKTPLWLRCKEILRFIRHVRMRHFDVAIDVQSNTKSGGVAFASGAPLRICHGGDEAKEITLWLNNHPVSPLPEMPHILQRNLHLLLPLDIQAVEPEFPLPADPFAKVVVDSWLVKQRLNQGSFVLIIPFCGNTKKEWPRDKFIALSRKLSEAGIPAVYINGPGREEETRAFIPSGCEKTIFLGPPTSILEMVELVRAAGVCVGGDTGPIQIAGGFDVPCVALFGPTAPERSKPWGRSSVLPLDADVDMVLQSIRSWQK